MAKTDTDLGTMVWSDRNPWVEKMDPTPRMMDEAVSLLLNDGFNTDSNYTSTLGVLEAEYGPDAVLSIEVMDVGHYDRDMRVTANITFERMETPEDTEYRIAGAEVEALKWERRSAAAQVRAEKQRAKRQAEQDVKYRQYLELKKIFEKMEKENPPTT